MSFEIRGSTDFYEGWLAWVLLAPMRRDASREWLLGWDMAQETGEEAVLAIRPEIKLGHIIVKDTT